MENGCAVSNARTRKGLNDITNLQQQSKGLAHGAKLLLQPGSLTSKDYIDKLQQENMLLMKVLAERNKVIELSGIELQKLRINLDKFQQQNLQLAQANSQMLAKLNSGQDRLKALKHELGCKDALLQAIKPENKANIVACPTSGDEGGTKKCAKAGESLEEDEDGDVKPCNAKRCGEAGESHKEDGEGKPCNAKRCVEAGEPRKEDGGNKPCNIKRKRQSKILGPNIKSVQAKEAADKKSVCLRRQSARFKAKEPETNEDVEVNNTQFLVSSSCDDKVHESGPISSDSSIKSEHEEDVMTPRNEGQELQRVSVGRPLRRAVEKIKSYKEIPINVKMRREK